MKRHKEAIKRIKRTKGVIDTKGPKVPKFLRERKKQKLLKQLENEKVQKENTILMKKLQLIDKGQGKLNANRIYGRVFKPTKSHQQVNRKRMVRKIETENNVIKNFKKAFIKRINSSGTLYSRRNLLRSAQEHRKLQDNIRKNARRQFTSQKEAELRRRQHSARKEGSASYQITRTRPSLYSGRKNEFALDTADADYHGSDSVDS